jgi:hypothetical protein
MYTNTVRVKNTHGLYAAWTHNVDLAIERFLPASPRQLRLRLSEYLGHEISGSLTVTDMLVMLASPEAGQFPTDEHTTDYLYS